MGVNLERGKKAAPSTVPDADIMRTIIATVIAVVIALLLHNIQEVELSTVSKPSSTVDQRPARAEVSPVAKASGKGGTKKATVKIVPRVDETPIADTASPSWAVKTSPHPQVSVGAINRMLAHLQKKGLSKQGAAYLTGNFIGESHLVPCGNVGDGGQAEGFAQWHPGRRYDMPCGFIEQLDWAIDVEMVRDSAGSYPCLCEALKTSDTALIMLRLQQWERWGLLGNRWIYATNIYSQL